MSRFARKVAVVTGAGSGIGRATTLLLAQEGASIAVADVNIDSANKTIADAQGGGKCIAVRADVSSRQDVENLFSEVKRTYGRLDILVNNAGIIPPKPVPTAQLDDVEWNKLLSVHLYGTLACTREALKMMQPQKYGKIVNISSICGLTGCSGYVAYSTAKAAIIGLTKSLAREVIGDGINVNAVAPGNVETPATKIYAPTDEVRNMLLAQVPMGRFGTPTEIASIVAYLASDDAGYMVGQIISPNGGQVM